MPLKVRAKFVEQKEKRLADMEPEKADAAREKKRWQNAETRLKGEKVTITKTIIQVSAFLSEISKGFDSVGK